MQNLSVADVLARTATHQADAWRLAIGGGVVLAAVALLLSGGTRADLRRAAACLAAGVLGAAAGATLLPILLRSPAALIARSAAPLLVGDRMAIGALVGFWLAAALAAKGMRLDRQDTLDRLAASMGVLVVSGRVGCFLEGCDFGTVTTVPWGVRYPAGSHAFGHQLARELVRATDRTSLAVHPAQLYEAAVGVLMIAAAVWIGRRALPHASGDGGDGRGRTGAFRGAICVYSIGRFLVEMVRGDERGAFGPLSLPQCLCLALLAGCAAGWLGERRTDEGGQRRRSG